MYKKLISEFNLDIRNYIHGHDFIEIFFLYVNKIKNTHKFKEENFGKALFLATESNALDTYPLFKTIAS